MKITSFLLLAVFLGTGCSSIVTRSSGGVSGTPPTAVPHFRGKASARAATKLMVENEALAEWQVARLAAACNTLAATNTSETRREALRLKAAHATSSYSVVCGPNSLVQVLDLLSMAILSRQVWVEDGRAIEQFGDQGKILVEAILAIHSQVQSHALQYLSSAEVHQIEETVLAWRRSHQGPMVTEFIRFDAYADQLAETLAAGAADSGILARVRSAAHHVEMLGERVILLAGRMPRLTEWHAEAAVANLMATGEVGEALSAVHELGGMPRVLHADFTRLDAHLAELPGKFQLLDDRLASLPSGLLTTLTNQPEYSAALSQLEQSGQQVKTLLDTVQSLDRQVAGLTHQLSDLTAVAKPESIRSITTQAASGVLSMGRSFILLVTACLAGLLVLGSLLLRWAVQTGR